MTAALVQRIPLTVIGGFLGAGKTTLLNYWLRETQGKRFAVLVNDFGAINIDASMIATANGDTIALTNGCVCCNIGDDLSQALIRVLDASPPYDGIVIEASGVSDPWRIAQIGLAEPSLALDGVIVLLDTSALAEHLANPLLRDSIERPLAHADLVVLNKVDLVAAETLSAARAWLKEFAPRAHRVETKNGAVPLPMLSGLHLPELGEFTAAQAMRRRRGGDHVDQFAAWSSAPERAFTVDEVKTWLKAPPTGLLRLKGWIHTVEHGWSEVQFSGRNGSVRRALVARSEPALIAIGLAGELPVPALDAFWDSRPRRSLPFA